MRAFLFPVILLALGHAVPAGAANWAMIDSVETKGDRSIYYAEYNEVRVYSDPSLASPPAPVRSKKDSLPPPPFGYAEAVDVEVMQVFESAARPRFSNYRVTVDCAGRRMRIASIDSLFRDGRSEFGSKGTNWFALPPDGWLSRVNTIACERPAVDAATRKAASTQSYDPLMELGLLHIGDFVLSYPIVELTWSTFWPDAVEPPIRELSPAEAEEQHKRLDQQIANLRQQLDGYVALGQASLADQNSERDFMSRIRPNFTGKMRMQQAIFGGMAGWTEAEVIDFWGRPAGVRQIGPTRAFDYEASYDTRQLIVQQLEAGDIEYEVGEFEYCALTLFMEPGGSKPGLRLVDFAVGGENCKRATLNDIRR